MARRWWELWCVRFLCWRVGAGDSQQFLGRPQTPEQNCQHHARVIYSSRRHGLLRGTLLASQTCSMEGPLSSPLGLCHWSPRLLWGSWRLILPACSSLPSPRTHQPWENRPVSAYPACYLQTAVDLGEVPVSEGRSLECKHYCSPTPPPEDTKSSPRSPCCTGSHFVQIYSFENAPSPPPP